MIDSKNVGEPPDTGARTQKRKALTRHELLRSARAIFSRDGFEHARIEDIAANAGKTRGAFYASFKDKEDVFCAIFEENLDRDMAELTPLILGLSTLSERVDALCNYLTQVSEDRERILLSLEFKLYAIRNPGKRKRLADLHRAMRLRSAIPELDTFMSLLAGPGSSEKLSDSLAICGVLEGLALNHLFDPEMVDLQELARYMRLCLGEALRTTDAPTIAASSPRQVAAVL